MDSSASSAPLPGLRSAFQAIAAERAHERALALRRSRASLLTERESEVLALIASGLTNGEIADYLTKDIPESEWRHRQSPDHDSQHIDEVAYRVKKRATK